MAVKLPTRDSLGPLPTSRGGSIASISPGALPRGAAMGAIGTGIAQIGRGLEQASTAADHLEQYDRKRQEFETEQKFQEFDWGARQSLDASMRSIEPGTARTFPDAATQSYQEGAKEFFKSVPEHLKPQYEAKLFSTERDLYGAATTFARGEQKRAGIETLDNSIQTIYGPRARVGSTDELDKVTGDYERLVKSNPDLTPIEQDELLKKGKRAIALSHLDALPPDQAQALVSGRLAGATESVPDRIVKVESGGRYNATNPNSSAAGPGQFIKETWLDVVKRNRPDVAEGRTDQELLALRTDPKYAAFGKEMVAAYAKENGDKLQQNGIATTPGNVYLAHFLGAEGAVKVLTADPNTPVSNLVTAKAFNSNRSVMDGKTAGDLAAWSDRKMGGAVSGALSSLTDQDWQQAQQRADQRFNAARIDAEHQTILQQKQIKAVSDEAENEFFGKIVKGDPAVTASAIADDKRMTPDTKRQMLSLLEHVGKTDRTDATYGKEFFGLFQRIHAPEGDPNRITDPAMLYEYVKPGGGLTLSGMEKLRAEIGGKKTPEGSAEGEMKQQFLRAAKHAISGRNDMYGIPDPKGEQLYLKFLGHVLPAYDAARAKGIPANRLLDPDGPDYIGKGLLKEGAGFVRPMSERTSDLSAASEAGAKPKFDTTTPQGLIMAVQSGKVTREEGERLAIERGWVRQTVRPPRQ